MSRRTRPKQFLPLGGANSLLRRTWDRARALARPSSIWVVAPEALAASVRRELPGLHPKNLVLEPSPRDTGPAIALACAAVSRRDPAAIVGILPTDHLIRNQSAFARAFRESVRAAADGALVCLGVSPDRPSTGFGYLLVAKAPRGVRAVPVARFIEKPDRARARRYVESGRYLWNGGMFVWRVDAFLDVLSAVAPALHAVTVAGIANRQAAWRRVPAISVDHAVMEKAPHVMVVPLDAGWDDVGSWDAAARHAAGAASGPGKHVLLGSDGAVVFGDKRLVAIVDLPGIVVVDTPDALLVVSRKSSEKVKSVVAAVRAAGRKDLL